MTRVYATSCYIFSCNNVVTAQRGGQRPVGLRRVAWFFGWGFRRPHAALDRALLELTHDLAAVAPVKSAELNDAALEDFRSRLERASRQRRITRVEQRRRNRHQMALSGFAENFTTVDSRVIVLGSGDRQAAGDHLVEFDR